MDVASDGKPSAVALYDYNAGEPNEVSFSEGDNLTDIEVSDFILDCKEDLSIFIEIPTGV